MIMKKQEYMLRNTHVNGFLRYQERLMLKILIVNNLIFAVICMAFLHAIIINNFCFWLL